jgi:hypothetical protein
LLGVTEPPQSPVGVAGCAQNIAVCEQPTRVLEKIGKLAYNRLRLFFENGGAMAQYEVIREIFNQCSGNQMRDVFIEEIETDDPNAVVQKYLAGQEVACTKTVKGKGRILFDVTTDGMLQRISFTEVGA